MNQKAYAKFILHMTTYLVEECEPFLFLTKQLLLKRSGKTIHKIAFLPEIKTIRILEKCLVIKFREKKRNLNSILYGWIYSDLFQRMT